MTQSRRGFLASLAAAVAGARALLAGDTGGGALPVLRETPDSQSSTFLVCERCAGHWPPIPCDHDGLKEVADSGWNYVNPSRSVLTYRLHGGVAGVPEEQRDWFDRR